MYGWDEEEERVLDDAGLFLEGAMIADLAGGEGSEDEAEAALGTESGRLQQIWERIARGLEAAFVPEKVPETPVLAGSVTATSLAAFTWFVTSACQLLMLLDCVMKCYRPLRCPRSIVDWVLKPVAAVALAQQA